MKLEEIDGLAGIRVIRDEALPARTMIASPDVYELLKYCDKAELIPPKRNDNA